MPWARSQLICPLFFSSWFNPRSILIAWLQNWPAMSETAVRLRERWTNGGKVEVPEERLTLSIVSKTLFSANKYGMRMTAVAR